jgi:hypothetical protein
MDLVANSMMDDPSSLQCHQVSPGYLFQSHIEERAEIVVLGLLSQRAPPLNSSR